MQDPRDISRRAIHENKLQLSSRELWHYYGFSIIFLLSALGFLAFMIFSDMSDGIDVIFSASLFLIAVVVFVIKKLIKERMLKFRSIETNMTPDQQCSYLRWVIEEKLKWEITEINEYLIIARTPESAGNPMGETVTIVFDSGRILLNSIGDLKHYRYHSITAFGWNRHNLNILTEYIGDTQDRD